MIIRRALRDEGERLREIAFAAKGHWGYEPDRVREWAAGPDLLRGKEIHVAEAEGRAIAWAALIPRGEVVVLEDLWVEPEWMGKRIGSRLFDHCAERATGLGGTRMEWEAEPNAIGFYEKLGGRYLRESEPSGWGRVLPVMGIDLPAA